jgi:hypothetical protein
VALLPGLYADPGDPGRVHWGTGRPPFLGPIGAPCLSVRMKRPERAIGSVTGGRSGTGAKTDRHPVRSGQRVDGRNRNENPVAGRGTRAGRVAHNLPKHGAPKRLATQHDERGTGDRHSWTKYRTSRQDELVVIDSPGRCRMATPVPRRPCGELCVRPYTFRVRGSIATPAGVRKTVAGRPRR